MPTIPDSRHRQSPTCSLRATLDPAGVKRRDIGPAVGDQLPEESAGMEFSRTTPVVRLGEDLSRY
jgi:hypothetical protein